MRKQKRPYVFSSIFYITRISRATRRNLRKCRAKGLKSGRPLDVPSRTKLKRKTPSEIGPQDGFETRLRIPLVVGDRRVLYLFRSLIELHPMQMASPRFRRLDASESTTDGRTRSLVSNSNRYTSMFREFHCEKLKTFRVFGILWISFPSRDFKVVTA